MKVAQRRCRVLGSNCRLKAVTPGSGSWDEVELQLDLRLALERLGSTTGSTAERAARSVREITARLPARWRQASSLPLAAVASGICVVIASLAWFWASAPDPVPPPGGSAAGSNLVGAAPDAAPSTTRARPRADGGAEAANAPAPTPTISPATSRARPAVAPSTTNPAWIPHRPPAAPRAVEPTATRRRQPVPATPSRAAELAELAAPTTAPTSRFPDPAPARVAEARRFAAPARAPRARVASRADMLDLFDDIK